jgi:hypothetical protein
MGKPSEVGRELSFRHAREFFAFFLTETQRARSRGWEARALLGLCDRYYLLTEILGRSDMLWHGDPGESVPAGNAWLYERCREVEAAPDDRLDVWARDHYKGIAGARFLSFRHAREFFSWFAKENPPGPGRRARGPGATACATAIPC